MIVRYAEKIAGYTLPEINSNVVFADSEKISSYVIDAVTAMQWAGSISGGQQWQFSSHGNNAT